MSDLIIPINIGLHTRDFICLNDLTPDHLGRQYASYRKIPDNLLTDIYYTEYFLKFTQDIMDEKMFKNQIATISKFMFPTENGLFLDLPYKPTTKTYTKDPRIVFVIRDITEKIVKLSARQIDFDLYKIENSMSKIRYLNIEYKEHDITKSKYLNLHKINNNNTVYAVEGTIDGLFLKNGISIGGVLQKDIQNLKHYFNDYVVCLDNETINRMVLNSMIGLILDNQKVFIWPNNLKKFKDFNQMIMSGYTPDQILIIVQENTFQGQQAKDKLLEWLYVE